MRRLVSQECMLMAVYEQVAQTLEEEIRSRFSSGEFLPSEAELAKRFSINRHTVRRAIDELVHAGLVLRQHGKGTMVVDNKIEYSISSRGRFTETLEEQGLHSDSRLVSVQRFEADSVLAARMLIEPGTGIVQLDTLRTIENTPICLIRHHLVAARVPDIESEFKKGSLHAYMEQRYGHRLQRRECIIGATLPTCQEASLLRCHRQLPLLVVRSINTLWDQPTIMEYSVSLSRSDTFEMKLNPDGVQASIGNQVDAGNADAFGNKDPFISKDFVSNKPALNR